MGAEDTPQTNASPSMLLTQLLWPGGVAVQAIHVAAKLGLADLVAAGPKTVVELSEVTLINAAVGFHHRRPGGDTLGDHT